MIKRTSDVIITKKFKSVKKDKMCITYMVPAPKTDNSEGYDTKECWYDLKDINSSLYDDLDCEKYFFKPMPAEFDFEEKFGRIERIITKINLVDDNGELVKEINIFK